MVKVIALNGEIEITFNKRSMWTFVVESDLSSAMQVDDMSSDVLKTLASNFALFWSRTESIVAVNGTHEQEATDWIDFWNESKDETDYQSLSLRYLKTLPLEINNAWHDAYKEQETMEVGRVDPELGDPDAIPDKVLKSPKVKKKDR